MDTLRRFRGPTGVRQLGPAVLGSLVILALAAAPAFAHRAAGETSNVSGDFSTAWSGWDAFCPADAYLAAHMYYLDTEDTSTGQGDQTDSQVGQNDQGTQATDENDQGDSTTTDENDQGDSTDVQDSQDDQGGQQTTGGDSGSSDQGQQQSDSDQSGSSGDSGSQSGD